MRILYFHQYFTTPDGAAGLRSYQMARHLVEQGHEVTMVCGSRSRSASGLTSAEMNGVRIGTVDGIHVIQVCIPYSNYDSLFKRTITFLRLALKNVMIARKCDYDLLFATSTPLTAGIPGIVMRFLKPRRPFVFEVRDLWPELPREMGVIRNPLILGAMSVLEWLSYNCARGCIGLSPGIVRGIRRRCSKKKAVTMIPNGCDIELFKPKAREKNQQASFRAVFTGAHGMANGLDAVLNAAAILKRKGRTDIELVFIGDGKLKPALVERAKREQLDNCVFLDPVPKMELAQKMKEFDAGMMILANIPAFYYGTSPNKFFDYIAGGLPVINNYPGWLADMIQEHECGIVVPPEDPDAFADALIQLAESPELCAEMGTNARNLAKMHFDRKNLARTFCEFLEEQVPGSETSDDTCLAPGAELPSEESRSTQVREA